jgi:hypothetical protein
MFCRYLFYFVTIWYVLWLFVIFNDHLVCMFCRYVVYFVAIWYIFSRFGTFNQKYLATLVLNMDPDL